MPALLKLADKLASPTLSHKTIKDGLRVLGFRASIVSLKQVLTVSSALEPHFQKLETVFPSAERILGDFRRSTDILAALDSAADFPGGNEPFVPITWQRLSARQLAITNPNLSTSINILFWLS